MKDREVSNKELIMIDLVHNQSYFKALVKDLTDQLPVIKANEDPVFNEDIMNNYYDLIRKRMLTDITTRLQVNAEDALIMIEGLNIEEYIK